MSPQLKLTCISIFKLKLEDFKGLRGRIDSESTKYTKIKTEFNALRNRISNGKGRNNDDVLIIKKDIEMINYKLKNLIQKSQQSETLYNDHRYNL